jgi:FHS family glucose/mannose:H+ symporter-like MFS transporter
MKTILAKIQLPLVILSYVGCLIYGFIGTARGTIYPDLLTTFHITNTEGSLFYSLASATGLIANLTTYRWYPRFGPIQGTTIFLLLTALGTWMVSVGPTFEITLVGAAVLGFAMAGSGLLTNVVGAQSTEDVKLRRQVLAGLHACYGAASMLAPLIVTGLTKAGCDWRLSFAILGLTPLAAAIYSARTKDHSPKTVWKDAFVEHKPWRRTMWYASVCTFYVAVETLLQTRLVQYGRDALGFDAALANTLLSAFFFTFFLGRLAFTLIPLKHSNMAILMTSSIASLVFFFVGLYVNPWGFALAGAGCSVFYPCIMSLLAEELGPATAFAMSWCQTLQSVGVMLMHVGVGYLTDKFGLPSAMVVGSFCFGIVIVLLMIGRPRV